MSKMAELEYEQRMAADQPEPYPRKGGGMSIREAAEAVMRAWEAGKSLDDLEAAADALRAALAQDRLNDYLPPKRDERRTFNEWWNYGEVSGNNPYRHESAAWWALEGWQAGVKAEREACAAICERHATGFDGEELSDWKSGYGDGAGACFNVIRARGEE